MASNSGEIEEGMASCNNDIDMMISHFIDNDFQRLSHPSSSSDGSPTGSYFVPNNLNTTTTSANQATLLPMPKLLFPTSDDEALTQAMIAVLSNSTQLDLIQSPTRSAFEPDRAKILSKIDASYKVHYYAKEAASMSANQMQHMISERKRRKLLSESFEDLSSLLPKETKKDKASILETTKEYMRSLRLQIADLQEKNRMLEMRLPPINEAGEESYASAQRVNVEVRKAMESTSALRNIDVSITVKAECDMIDLLLHVLECLKKMGDIILVSVEANGYPRKSNYPCKITRLALKIQKPADSDWDEKRLKEAIKSRVDEVFPPLATQAP